MDAHQIYRRPFKALMVTASLGLLGLGNASQALPLSQSDSVSHTHTSRPTAEDYDRGVQGADGQKPTQIDPADRNYISQIFSKIHMVDKMEMSAGSLAKAKGSTANVKHYGDQLYKDHFSADAQVVALAHDKGINILENPIPDGPADEKDMAEQKRTMKELESSQGLAFDTAFLESMEAGHSKMIELLKEADQRIQDTQCRLLVGKLIPILQQHEDMAEHIDAKSNKRVSSRKLYNQ